MLFTKIRVLVEVYLRLMWIDTVKATYRVIKAFYCVTNMGGNGLAKISKCWGKNVNKVAEYCGMVALDITF